MVVGAVELHALPHALTNAFVESVSPSGLAPKLTTFKVTASAMADVNVNKKSTKACKSTIRAIIVYSSDNEGCVRKLKRKKNTQKV